MKIVPLVFELGQDLKIDLDDDQKVNSFMLWSYPRHAQNFKSMDNFLSYVGNV